MDRKEPPLRSGSTRHGEDQATAEGSEPPPIRSPKDQEHEAILVAPDDKGQKPVKDGEKAVAGRKKLKGGEKWDMATGKEAPKAKDSSEDKEDGKEETSEEHEVEVELNAILKKGPSESAFAVSSSEDRFVVDESPFKQSSYSQSHIVLSHEKRKTFF